MKLADKNEEHSRTFSKRSNNFVNGNIFRTRVELFANKVHRLSRFADPGSKLIFLELIDLDIFLAQENSNTLEIMVPQRRTPGPQLRATS